MTPHPTLQAFNWRDAGMLTPVRDQKSCGSCWAFTTMGVIEGANRITNNVAVDLSEQYLVDCSGAGTCNGGWYGDAFDFMKVNGALTERDRPYKAANGSCTTPRHQCTCCQLAYVKPDASKALFRK